MLLAAGAQLSKGTLHPWRAQLGVRGSGGCPGLLVLQESSKTPGKGLLSDREAGPRWADSPSISDVVFCCCCFNLLGLAGEPSKG